MLRGDGSHPMSRVVRAATVVVARGSCSDCDPPRQWVGGMADVDRDVERHMRLTGHRGARWHASPEPGPDDDPVSGDH